MYVSGASSVTDAFVETALEGKYKHFRGYIVLQYALMFVRSRETALERETQHSDVRHASENR